MQARHTWEALALNISRSGGGGQEMEIGKALTGLIELLDEPEGFILAATFKFKIQGKRTKLMRVEGTMGRRRPPRVKDRRGTQKRGQAPAGRCSTKQLLPPGNVLLNGLFYWAAAMHSSSLPLLPGFFPLANPAQRHLSQVDACSPWKMSGSRGGCEGEEGWRANRGSLWHSSGTAPTKLVLCSFVDRAWRIRRWNRVLMQRCLTVFSILLLRDITRNQSIQWISYAEVLPAICQHPKPTSTTQFGPLTATPSYSGRETARYLPNSQNTP
ncbi:hypothetical protein F5144DRAFT_338141 [Chaetomium tenue]|uniref:Uncharacterized protein n=1 Tax=Chaetomium tenue TaxID=1854479 RepID=A0ACB7NWT0_9PEZI|nr:hypothetical protein F5144DRAFT_338141 [Chaetomium globosum]